LKLFAKYNRFSIIATVAIFILSGIAFYFVMKYVLTDQVDDALKLERNEIELAVAKHHHLPEPQHFKQQSVFFTQVNQPFNKSVFSTIKFVDTADNETEDYRQLQFGISVNNNHYLVTVRNSLVEADELLRSILPVVLGTIVLILATIFIINRVVLKKLWSPFYKTLFNISDFEVSSSKHIEFEDTRIEEFAFMNAKLENLTRNVQTEYDILKQFTENASHEMQTPLAVVNSKLDLLANDENLSLSQSKLLEGALDAVQKLSRLNQSLLLLAKIENKQFTAKQSIPLQARILQKLESLR
jgi:signal transduction histidine kinase